MIGQHVKINSAIILCDIPRPSHRMTDMTAVTKPEEILLFIKDSTRIRHVNK